jgi:hypothetical protein
MYESLSVLELRQEEAFERIVRHLAEMAGLDVDDATVRGFLAAEAESLIAIRRDSAFAQEFSLESDTVLTELVGLYEDLDRSITERLAGEISAACGAESGMNEDTDLTNSFAMDRCWSDDR